MLYVRGFFLFISMLSMNLCAATDAQDRDSTPIAERSVYKLPDYEISIVRGRGLSPQDRPLSSKAPKTLERLRQMDGVYTIIFNIVKDDHLIGALNIQWIPDPNQFFAENPYGVNPIIRITNICVGEGAGDGYVLDPAEKNISQGKGVGTMAMETLLATLQVSDFPKNTNIVLDCILNNHLPRWYSSFGFKNLHTPKDVISNLNINYMLVPLPEVKFPLHEKRQKAERAKPY